MDQNIAIKKRIVEGARDLFLKQGVQVSTLEIASALGISKNTLYEYFPNKDALLKAVLDTILDAWLASAEEIFKSDDTLGHKIEKLFIHIAQYMRHLTPSTMFNVKKYHPHVYTAVKTEQENRLHEIMERTVKSGLKDGSIRPTIDIEFLIRFSMHAFEMLQDDSILSTMNFTFDRMIRNITTLLFFGVLSDEGRKTNNELLQRTL